MTRYGSPSNWRKGRARAARVATLRLSNTLLEGKRSPESRMFTDWKRKAKSTRLQSDATATPALPAYVEYTAPSPSPDG